MDMVQLQNIPLPLAIISENGKVTFCNDVLCRSFGRDITGQSIDAILNFDAGVAAFLESVDDKALSIRLNAADKADGVFRAVFVREHSSSVIVMQLFQETEQVAGAAKRIDVDFLSGISHQIRTPVNGVLGIAELLAETTLSPEQAKYVDILARSGHALIHLVNEIQEIALLEQGATVIAQNNIDIRMLVQDAMDLFSVSVSQKGVIGYVDIDAGVPKVLVSDRRRLHQILVNLVGNAFQFTDQGKVKIAVAVNDGISGKCLTIDVIDNGIGIDKGRLPDLFKKTGHSADRQNQSYSKTGLGLILCHEIVRLMGGTITVDSTLGRGTHVRVDLPVSLAVEADVQMQDRDAASMDTRAYAENVGPWHVLVTEDNPVNQMLFRKVLERFGHKVTVASNGQEAVMKVQLGGKFDAILMDISMPIMDGLDATAMIRSLYGPAGSTPILALTAHAMDGDREKFLNAGMDGYQSKPVDPSTLQQAIADVIRLRQDEWSPNTGSTAPEQWAPRANEREH